MSICLASGQPKLTDLDLQKVLVALDKTLPFETPTNGQAESPLFIAKRFRSVSNLATLKDFEPQPYSALGGVYPHGFGILDTL